MNDGAVDRHDLGSGEMNVFIYTDFPERVFDRLRQIVGTDLMESSRAAYRGIDEDEYVILWPKGLKSFAVS